LVRWWGRNGQYLMSCSQPRPFELYRVLHDGKLPIHSYELFSGITGIATIRYSDYRGDKNQEFVPIASFAPRMLKSLPAIHVLTFVCFLLCLISVSAFIWSLMDGMPLFILVFGLASLVSSTAFAITLDWLDRITLNS